MGARVKFSGCAPKRKKGTAFGVTLSARIGRDGQITDSARDVRCYLHAAAPGSARVRADGTIFGYFEVPFTSQTCGPVRPGLYTVDLGCHACDKTFRVTGPRALAGPIGYVNFASAEGAARFIDRQLDIPVVLPSPLPSGATLRKTKGVWVNAYGGRGTARIELTWDRKILILDYGSSGFDGCGGDDAEVVSISGKRGLVTFSANKGDPWSQVIWPVKPGHLAGTYGLYGSVRRAEALQMARSMQVAIDAREGPDPGC
jgi:hypothetical protein